VLNKSRDAQLYAQNAQYTALSKQLRIYHDAAKAGGWQPIPAATSLRKGASSPAVSALKKRLQLTKDYPDGDTTAVYNDSLATVIKNIQSRYGLLPNGQVNDSLVKVLNVPVEERLSQIIINMNRARWQGNASTTDSNRIEVDIPAQMLYVMEGARRVMEMPVVVGKEGTGTVMFEGTISQVVFSPYWNVPQSIVKNELMPKMKNNPGYLKEKNMEVVKQNDSVPVIRQLPGKENALGGVKFLFPNRYDIFLHDTPDKSLFKKKERALSHGCIRVAKPDSLAAYILRGQSEWTPEKITAAMKAGKQQEVKVARPVPVRILYLTASVDGSGALLFREDPYGHDARAKQKLFTAGG
jgi:L,D-transpeptidase YcbB